ncbi:flagellar motor protein MotB [Peredibacter sp. HCB2-198]|uniref:flagellar motor protein MotB n=1 Tax=Peredibacter sp. HCB2-198 TaxID=3383025 RepID=UPI0038B69065
MADAPKCPPCKPGAPGWLATFSDLCTLLLTFFILLLSFAKTETAKYEAAIGSLRNAFGGNVLKPGEVMRPGKSPSDAPTMIDSDMPSKPFPIEFLTAEGLLDKHEINRESDTQLNQLKKMLADNELSESANVYEMPETIMVRMKDKVQFQKGSVGIDEINIQVFDHLVKMMRENNWNIMVEGHAEAGEVGKKGEDAYELSSQRALAVSKSLIQRGISADRITTIFYGDSRPQEKVNRNVSDRRVEFLLKKVDLRTEGRKVEAQ